jgi:hypothetical protein
VNTHLIPLCTRLLRCTLVYLFSALALLPAAERALAEDQDLGISGAWRFSSVNQNGDKRTAKLTLKQEGDKLTGKYVDQNNDSLTIENGKIVGDEISFTTTRGNGNQKFVVNYSGKIEGEKIKGKSEFERNKERRMSNWVAEKKKPLEGATGTWKWTFPRENGQEANFTLKLNQTGNQLTGVSISPTGNEIPISEAKVQGKDVSFKAVRERDDRKLTTTFQGTRDGETITGKVQTDWTGEIHDYDWKAKRLED